MTGIGLINNIIVINIVIIIINIFIIIITIKHCLFRTLRNLFNCESNAEAQLHCFSCDQNWFGCDQSSSVFAQC